MKKFAASIFFSAAFAVGCSNPDLPTQIPAQPDNTGTADSGTPGTNPDGGPASGTDMRGGGPVGPSDGGPPVIVNDGGIPLDLPPPDHAPTVHAPQPTFTTSTSGTMTAPQVYTIVWNGDGDEGTKITDFTAWMFSDPYWTNWGPEYGITGGQSMGLITLPGAPPASWSDAQAQALIKKSVGTTGWPATANSNTIFGFVLNPKTKSTQNGGAQGCTAYDGYHSATQQGIPYYIAVRCIDPTTMTDSFDELTITISHEIAEAASDPFGDQNLVQGIPGGGEIGDICLIEDLPITAPSGVTYQVQRLYSNKAAKAGTTNPCVPDDGAFYFGASLVSTAAGPQQITINTDSTGAGSASFNVETFAYGNNPTAAVGWAFDSGDFLPTGMTFTPNVGRGQDAMGNTIGVKEYGYPGTTFPVTVAVDSTVQQGSYITVLFSTLGTGPTERINSFWVVINVQ